MRAGGRRTPPARSCVSSEMLVVSPRLYRLLLEHGIRGYAVEAAHLV